ncbi:MAG: hypothetical protein Kow0042_21810 [Calditrichia bacterium]
MNFHSVIYSFLVFLLVISGTQVWSASIEVSINPVQDNTLYEDANGSLSNGSGIYFFVGNTLTSFSRRALLMFDIAGNIPAGAIIDSVYLKLNMSRTIAGNQDVALYRVLKPWGEGASNAPGQEGGGAPSAPGDATWIHTFYDTSFWANPGGDFAALPSATQSVDGLGTYTWGSTPLMSADVQDWLDNPATNFGWIAVGNESVNTTAKRFDSRENPNPNNRPLLTIYYSTPQITFQQTIQADWNLIGLPLMVSDPYYLSLFPNAVPNTLFGFNGSYVPEDTLELSRGYWLRFPTDSIYSIQGLPVDTLSLQLLEGWNLLAGPSCTVALSDVSDPGSIITPGTLFGFNGSYVLSDSLKPGSGYWLRANAAGQVTMFCGNRFPPFSRPNYTLPTLNTEPSLQIGDGAGHQQTLYFGVKLNNPARKNSYSLPPLPPAGVFDARFAGDYRISETDEALIHIQASQYPISIEATNLNPEAGYQYVLREVLPGDEGKTYPLVEGESIEITNPAVRSLRLSKVEMVPVEFAVQQNYPNPFNPTTEIRFALPQNEQVVVAVYNTLGQKVKTLVSDYLEAGYHVVRWDATTDSGDRVSSGIYFYRVNAGTHRVVKKMILMK